MARRVRGQLIEALLDGLPEACLGIDRSGRIRFINRPARQLLGVSEDVLEQELWDALPLTDFSRLLGTSIKASVPQPVEQVVVFPPDRAFVLQLVPVDNDEGRLQGWVALLRDMSAVKKLEQGLEQLVTDVNQQLKKPVTAIKGFVETLLEGAYTNAEVTKRFLQVINEETNRLARLIVTLEEASAQKAPEAKPVPTDLVPLLRSCVAMFSQVAAEKNLKLETDLPANLPPVQLVSDDFRRAVINLLDNAIKVTGLKGSGKVVLSAGPRRNYVEIHVADTGVGIDPEELDSIFERFTRVKHGPAAELGGTGLGLSVARDVVQRFGGTLTVKSEVGSGSTFTIQLPHAT